MKVFDLHCDTATACCYKKAGMDAAGFDASLQPHDFLRAQCFALFVHDERYNNESGEDMFRRYLAYFKAEMQRLSSCVQQCRSAQEVQAAWQQGKHAAILTVENGAAFSGKMENVHLAAQSGAKVVGITWNGENELACGSVTDQKKGLKPFGREAIKEMRRLGMTPDISHLSDAGVDELFCMSDDVVIATHSNLRSICDVPRNLTESMFREIVRRNGIVGLNLFIRFLGEDYDSPAVLLRHIYRMLELGGEKTVCLGCDMDGAVLPTYCKNAAHFPQLYAIVADALGEKVAEAVFYENAMRFFAGNEEAGA